MPHHSLTIHLPIGNLYRGAHALILLQAADGRFILGQKSQFYPPGIARMVGGGLHEGESPQEAAQRELREELGVTFAEQEIKYLCSIHTSAKTSIGDFEMMNHIFLVHIWPDIALYPSDDIDWLMAYSHAELADLVCTMQHLTGEYSADTFSVRWEDWGQIYAYIHHQALLHLPK